MAARKKDKHWCVSVRGDSHEKLKMIAKAHNMTVAALVAWMVEQLPNG